MANVNYPSLETAISWNSGPSVSIMQDYWHDLTPRTEGTINVRRGKQYELDQVQPGQMTMTLRNDDGLLAPPHPAPYINAYQVAPYRLIRQRAQWPHSVNMLTGDQASAWYQSRGATTTTDLPDYLNGLTYYGGSAVSVVTSGVSGANAYSLTLPTLGASFGIQLGGMAITHGTTYTMSALVTNTSGVAVTFQAQIVWANAYGLELWATPAVVGTAVVTSGTPQLVTVTGTAPTFAPGPVATPATGARIFLKATNAPAATISSGFTVSSLQFEAAATPSAFTVPKWYPLFVGYVERWPQKWDGSGTRGTVDLTCIDAFTFLANRGMPDPFTADLLALTPNFLYPLNEPTGALSFADATGKRSPITLTRGLTTASAKSGSSIASGDNTPRGIDVNQAITGGFLGGGGPVITQANFASGLGPPALGGAMSVSPYGVAPYYNPLVGPPVTGAFTRIIAARYNATTPVTVAQYIWSYNTPANSGVGFNILRFYLPPGGAHPRGVPGVLSQTNIPSTNSAFLQFPGLTTDVVDAAGFLDTDWHLFGVSFNAAATTMRTWADMQTTSLSTTSGTSLRAYPFDPTFGYDTIAGQVDDTTSDNGFSGDIAYVCELPFEMTGAQWLALATSWRNGWANGGANIEYSGERYARILGWLGYPSPTIIAAGDQNTYGPDNDIVGAVKGSGGTPTDALTALQNVVDTELGQHFIAADGRLVFQNRTARFSRAATVIFGENVTGGEIPYVNAMTDFDPTRIANDITVTTAYGGAVTELTDANSVASYGTVTLQRTPNTLSAADANYQAQYLLYANKAPLQRLEALPVDVSSHPSAFTTMLALELGNCVTVNRRPNGAPVITISGFLEQIEWNFDDQLGALCTLQVSNNSQEQFAILDSGTYGLLDSTAILGY